MGGGTPPEDIFSTTTTPCRIPGPFTTASRSKQFWADPPPPPGGPSGEGHERDDFWVPGGFGRREGLKWLQGGLGGGGPGLGGRALGGRQPALCRDSHLAQPQAKGMGLRGGGPVPSLPISSLRSPSQAVVTSPCHNPELYGPGVKREPAKGGYFFQGCPNHFSPHPLPGWSTVRYLCSTAPGSLTAAHAGWNSPGVERRRKHPLLNVCLRCPVKETGTLPEGKGGRFRGLANSTQIYSSPDGQGPSTAIWGGVPSALRPLFSSTHPIFGSRWVPPR